MRHWRRPSAVLIATALGGCVGGGGPEPNLVDGGGPVDMNVSMAIPIDAIMSMVSVDRTSGVIAVGNDKVTVTIMLVDG
jgi:hypothetical protein